MVPKLTLALALALFGSSAYAGFPSGSHNQQAVFQAINMGFACDGTTNDGPARSAAGAAIRADPRVIAGSPVTFIFPPGRTCLMTCNGSTDDAFAGIANMTIIATGATITGGGGGACSGWGAGGLYSFGIDGSPAGHINRRANTINIGDTCATMTTAGTESNYTVGKMVMLGGMGFQTTSFPPNMSLFEFKKIISINTITHQLCFDSPAKYHYDQSWPDFTGTAAGGQCGGVPCGGPPYIFGIPYLGFNDGQFCPRPNGASCLWDTTSTIIGGTWTTSGFFLQNNRTVILKNVTCTSPGSNNTCFYPSGNQNVLWINTSFTVSRIEADKEVQNWTISGGTYPGIVLQSASIQNLTLINGATVGFFNGFPGISLNCYNSSINPSVGGGGLFRMGNSFGTGNDLTSFNGNACSSTGGNDAGVARPSCCFGSTSMPIFVSNVQTPFVYRGAGVFTCNENDNSSCHDVLSWPQPGSHWIIQTALAVGFPFQLTNVTDNFPSSPLIQTISTNLALANLNNTPKDGGGNSSYVPDYPRVWNCINCTGSPDMVDLSLPGAQGKPFMTYTKKTFTCAPNVASVPGSIPTNNSTSASGIYGLLPVFGNLVQVAFNVITPDTNNIGATVATGGTLTDQTTGAQTSASNSVNLNIAGLRTVTTTTVTGAQSGDSLTARSGWLNSQVGVGTLDNASGISPFDYDTRAINVSNPSGCAVWTVELVTTR